MFCENVKYFNNLKDILKKSIIFKNHNSKKDSLVIMNTISQGKVDFSKSNTSSEDCKEYYFEDEDNMKKIWVTIHTSMK